VTSLDIHVEQSAVSSQFIDQFSQVISPFKEGTCPIRVFYQRDEAQAMLELGVQWRVTPADDLLYQLTLMLGEEKIALQFK
jgi:DNA polymerase-3 subunit alpha